MRRGFLLPLIVCLLFVPAAAAQAQLSKSIGIGVASPQGEFGDYFDEGYTVRGQFQLSALGLIAVHTQAGWTRIQFGLRSRYGRPRQRRAGVDRRHRR